MKIEFSLNPNCSEAVLRIRTQKLNKEVKDKLFKEIEKAVKKYDYETDVFWQKIFGIEVIIIKGDMPFNKPEELDAIINKYPQLKSEDIEREEE